jgi:hypothetical protein
VFTRLSDAVPLRLREASVRPAPTASSFIVTPAAVTVAVAGPVPLSRTVVNGKPVHPEGAGIPAWEGPFTSMRAAGRALSKPRPVAPLFHPESLKAAASQALASDPSAGTVHLTAAPSASTGVVTAAAAA